MEGIQWALTATQSQVVCRMGFAAQQSTQVAIGYSRVSSRLPTVHFALTAHQRSPPQSVANMPRKARNAAARSAEAAKTAASKVNASEAAAPAPAADATGLEASTAPAPAVPAVDISTLRPEEVAALSADAQARIVELETTNEELRRQIESTRQHAEALQIIKDSLAKEVDDFQDHGWRHELCGELEALKQQLADIQGYEEIPDTIMGPELSHTSHAAALVAAWQQLQAASLEEDVEFEEEEYPHEAVERMAVHLEEELEVVVEHLQAVKAQSTAVTVHKAHLEAEIKDIIERRAMAAVAAAGAAASKAAEESLDDSSTPALKAGREGKTDEV